MIQEIYPHQLDNQYHGELSPRATDKVLVYRGSGKKDDSIAVLEQDGIVDFPAASLWGNHELRYLFAIDDCRFYLGQPENINLPDLYSYIPIRSLRVLEPLWLCFAAVTGYHLFVWYRDSQFCGRCGNKTEHSGSLRMMQCPACGNQIFPRINPAVIIGLRNGNSLMMSRYAGRATKGRALLAGFCEIGETPEETVVREVMEEVGLKAKNVTYFSSQPWGFESDLLLGYYADVDGDTAVTLDENELASAAFVPRDEITYEPNLRSLTATMIETFRKGED